MAIENAKTLNVRIRNKYDSYENWEKSGLVLEAGEIAVAYTTVNVEVGNGKIEQHPELLMKVGNGSDLFSALPWLSAKAADVAAWAKAANKPTYAASEITGIADYIKDYVEDTMGITVDSNTVYRTVKVSDYEYKLQAKGATDADTAWADVADSAIVIPNDTEAIEALERLVGTKAVATQITEALAAYSTTEQMTAAIAAAKGEAVAHADGLNTTMSARVDALEAIDHDHTNKEALDSISAAKIAAWDAAEGNAKTHADGLNTAMDSRVAALEGKFTGEDSVAKQISDAVAAEAKLRDDADKALDEKIGTNADAIDALELLVGEKSVATQIAEAIEEEDLANTYAAKVHGHAIDDVEGLQDAIDAAEKAGTDAAAALETYKGTNDAAVQKVAGDLATEAQTARAAEKANADGITAINTKIGAVTEGKTVVEMIEAAQEAATYDDTELVAAIDALEGLVGTEKVADQIATAVAGEAEIARAAEKKNADAIGVLNGTAETEGSVDYKIAQKFATLMENPDEAMNSIKELVDWTTEHAGDALEMSNQVTANKNAIAKLNGGADEDGSVAKQVAAGVTEAKGYTDAEVKKLAEGAVATNAADILALEGLVGTEKVTDQIGAALDGALMVGEGEAKVEKYAKDADLAAIAKTGSTDDLVQGALTLVFDCGGAGV